MRSSTRSLLLLFLLSRITIANFDTQTDWSGGPGVPGPTGQWNDTFFESTGIDYAASPGDLRLTLPYGEHLVSSEVTGPSCVTLADFNGDGALDMATVSALGVFWFENIDGSGFEWSLHAVASVGAGRAWIASSDFDNDGDIDICASLSGKGLYWWSNDGSGISFVEAEIMAADTRDCCVADMDSDGWDDIVLALPETSEILWWRNELEGLGIWTNQTIDSDFSGAFTVDAVDMNGSGFPEVVAGSNTTGELALWINNGGSWDKEVIAGSNAAARDLAISDLDGDGLFDVIVADADEVEWWRNVSWIDWEKHTIIDLPAPVAIGVSNLNNDGDMDVLAVSYGSSGTVTCLENLDGTGLSWTEIDEFPSRNSFDIASGDINGDGIFEFATPSWEPHNALQYFRIGGYEQLGMLTSSILEPSSSFYIFWEWLLWESYEPGGTNVSMQFRGSADPDSWGPWSEWFEYPPPVDLSEYLTFEDRYFMYRVRLTSSYPWNTPIFNVIYVSWEFPPGIEEEPNLEEPLILMAPNPACGSFQLGFHLPVSGQVDLRIHDLTGHVVSEPVSGWMNAGSYSCIISDLPAGLYLCTFSAPGIYGHLQVMFFPE